MSATRYPRVIDLKDERSLRLRPLKASDEEALLTFFRGLEPESLNYMKRDVTELETVRSFCRNTDRERLVSLVALDGERIVAETSMRVPPRGWRRQVGHLRVVVDEAYRRRGLAKALVLEQVNQAVLWNVQKLEIEILDTQLGVGRIFSQIGFEEEARLKAHALDAKGVPHDIIIMTCKVGDIMARMEDLISAAEVVPREIS